MTSSSYNNGVSETRSYNADNTLGSIAFARASIGNLTYGWDNNHNKTSESIAGTMSNYGFTIVAFRSAKGYFCGAKVNTLNTADVGNNSSVDATYKFDALGRRVYRQSATSTMV